VPRSQLPDGITHVTARGAKQQALYLDPTDFEMYTTLLAFAFADDEVVLLGFCLMTNHVHLLVDGTVENVTKTVHWLHGCYASSFNRRHRAEGHVFDRRFGSTVIKSDEHLMRTYRYIARNPDAAGLCRRPAEWLWSSYADTIGVRRLYPFVAVEQLLAQFGHGIRARRAFAAYVEDTLS
jgi:REP element-mobilizing transposase RayT